MAVTIVLLGKLADLAGALELSVAGPFDWSGLITALPPALGDMVQDDKVRLAVNGELLTDKTAMQAKDGDEIALLPPVSGG